MKKKNVFIYCFMMLYFTPLNILALNTPKEVNAVYEFWDAARNYEAAAYAREYMANALIGKIQSTPNNDEDVKSYNDRVKRNASFKLQAAVQLIGAAGEWDHASRVYRDASRSSKDAEPKEYFIQLSRTSALYATALIRQAAEITERAALNYTEAGDVVGQIKANHEAGKIREQLAKRR